MFQNILIPLDGSKLAESVLTQLKIIINECRVNSVVFLQVIEPMFQGSTEAASEFNEDEIERLCNTQKFHAEEYLRKIVNDFDKNNINFVTKVVRGRVAETIVHFAEQNRINLIIMATHGCSGITCWVMGRVADRVINSSSVPIMIVRTVETNR